MNSGGMQISWGDAALRLVAEVQRLGYVFLPVDVKVTYP